MRRGNALSRRAQPYPDTLFFGEKLSVFRETAGRKDARPEAASLCGLPVSPGQIDGPLSNHIF